MADSIAQAEMCRLGNGGEARGFQTAGLVVGIGDVDVAGTGKCYYEYAFLRGTRCEETVSMLLVQFLTILRTIR